MRKLSLLCRGLLSVWVVAGMDCAGQESLPAAPSSTLSTAPDELQTKRVLGVMPNFRSVSPGQAVERPTIRQKFVTTTLDNFDYSSFIFDGFVAAGAFVGKSTPEFHQGAAGYGRYYWHTLADQSIENYWVEFIIPSINHEDSRYYAMGRRGGGVFRRAGYSLSRVVVTRSDEGKPMFNLGEVGGSAIAAGISTFYYPTREQTASVAARNWGLDVMYDAAVFVFHEFWPDVSHKLGVKVGATAGN
jgi:hypothetical protein